MHSVYPSTRMQQKSAGDTISQQVVHQLRRLSWPFFLRMALSCCRALLPVAAVRNGSIGTMFLQDIR